MCGRGSALLLRGIVKFDEKLFDVVKFRELREPGNGARVEQVDVIAILNSRLAAGAVRHHEWIRKFPRQRRFFFGVGFLREVSLGVEEDMDGRANCAAFCSPLRLLPAT